MVLDQIRNSGRVFSDEGDLRQWELTRRDDRERFREAIDADAADRLDFVGRVIAEMQADGTLEALHARAAAEGRLALNGAQVVNVESL